MKISSYFVRTNPFKHHFCLFVCCSNGTDSGGQSFVPPFSSKLFDLSARRRRSHLSSETEQRWPEACWLQRQLSFHCSADRPSATRTAVRIASCVHWIYLVGHQGFTKVCVCVWVCTWCVCVCVCVCLIRWVNNLVSLSVAVKCQLQFHDRGNTV